MINNSLVLQKDNWWWFKLNGILRHALAKGYVRGRNPVVMTEYPKSGGTWLSQMLSVAAELEYPRNRLPPLNRDIILHGCYFRTNDSSRTIVLWRDGRDIMISFYYHFMFDKPITSKRYSMRLKHHLGIDDPKDIRASLPRFIEWCFQGGYPGFTWNSFVDKWVDHPRSLQTSYELLLSNPTTELRKLLGDLHEVELNDDLIEAAIEEFRFENQAQRKPGEEDVTSFVRKGIAGDWKNHFNQESRDIFAHYSTDTLVRLGYEVDNSWVNAEL